MGAPTLTGDFSAARSEKRSVFIRWAPRISLGIYPGPARDIAWDVSGGRSGNRLGFFRCPLRISSTIFGIALGVSEHVPRHFPFKIPGDLDIRSKAMERHVYTHEPKQLETKACCRTLTNTHARRHLRPHIDPCNPPPPTHTQADIQTH